MTRIAILNSRQSKTPVGNDPWVKATLSAVDFAAANGWTIVSSFGLNPWELVTWAAGRHKAKLILVCPDDMSEENRSDLIRRFGLSRDYVEWVPIARGKGRSTVKNWWEGRDSEIVSLADALLPVSVRTGGRLETLIRSKLNAEIDERFRTPHEPTPHHDTDQIRADHLNPALSNWSPDWLIHWTRACYGPWPGETEAEFYSDLTTAADTYCRSGIETLRHILNEKRIRASSWRIGAGRPMVAFTELSPLESVKLMRWRQRWLRWSFEPYGIALRKDAAERLGVRAVRYVDEEEWKEIAGESKCFAHRRGEKSDIWSAEREWRCAGDVDLSRFSHDELQVLVRRRDERSLIDVESPHPCSSLESD